MGAANILRWLTLAGAVICASAGAQAPDAPVSAAARDPVQAAQARLESDPISAMAELKALVDEPAHPLRRRAQMALVSALAAAKRVDEARAQSDQLLADTQLTPGERADALRNRLNLMSSSRSWDDQDRVLPQVQAALDSAIDANSRSRLYVDLGVLHIAQSKFPAAQGAFENALKLAGSEPSERLAALHRNLGVAFAQQGRYPEAIEALHRSEAVLAQLGLPEDLGLLRNFGGLYMYMENWPRAIEYLERAQARVETPGVNESPASVLGIYGNLAGAYVGGKRAADAHRSFEKALAFAEAKGVPAPGVLNNQATLFREEGRHAEALERFERARAQFEALGAVENVGVTEKNIGETLIKLGDRERAAGHLQSAEKIYLERDIRPKRLELYPVLIENYEALGRPADALKAMQAFKALNDEVNSVESKERIAKLESAIELERKKVELSASEQSRSLQSTENQQLRDQRAGERVLTIAMVVSVIGLIIILIRLSRDRRFKARAHHELELRNARIEAQHRDLEVLNSALQRQSREDALTGLHNRFYLKEFMEAAHALVGGGRERPLESMLLIMADLDHFKRINDDHGHLTGDRVLVSIAEVLRLARREHDVLVRWGGEEFIWLCLDADAEHGALLCERLRQHLAEIEIIGDDGQAIRVTASLGFVPVPIWPGVPIDWELALRIADSAVYSSKAEGRDRWTGYRGVQAPVAAPTGEGLQVAGLEAAGQIERIAMDKVRG